MIPWQLPKHSKLILFENHMSNQEAGCFLFAGKHRKSSLTKQERQNERTWTSAPATLKKQISFRIINLLELNFYNEVNNG